MACYINCINCTKERYSPLLFGTRGPGESSHCWCLWLAKLIRECGDSQNDIKLVVIEKDKNTVCRFSEAVNAADPLLSVFDQHSWQHHMKHYWEY
jgi:hypothetical protein